MIAVQVFVGLVLFAAFLGLLMIVVRALATIGSFRRGGEFRRGCRDASYGQWLAATALGLAVCAAGGAVGWALA